MKQKNLFRELKPNEVTSIYGGGSWVTEKVNGILMVYWEP